MKMRNNIQFCSSLYCTWKCKKKHNNTEFRVVSLIFFSLTLRIFLSSFLCVFAQFCLRTTTILVFPQWRRIEILLLVPFEMFIQKCCTAGFLNCVWIIWRSMMTSMSEIKNQNVNSFKYKKSLKNDKGIGN